MSKTTLEIEKDTLERLKEAGKKSQTYDKLINQRITCNAVDCQNEGKIELKLRAGKFGLVTLFLCDQCVTKFIDTDSDTESEIAQEANA